MTETDIAALICGIASFVILIAVEYVLDTTYIMPSKRHKDEKEEKDRR